METTAADVLIDILHEDWGVDTIFGIPGDGINGVIEALRVRKDKIKFIQTRHEESAAFMACGYSKFTGKLGVCLATSGPGGIHLLNGLYDAKFDGASVLAITGMHFHDLLDTHSQQDVNLNRLFEDVTVYNTRVMGPAHVESVTQIACKTALAKKGVAHITIPVDFQHMPMSKKHASKRNKPHHASDVMAWPNMTPHEVDLNGAADLLNSGKRIAILVGQGANHATEEVIQAAETLGAPIVKALLGKGAIPDDCVYTTGSIGLLGTSPSQHAMEQCDTLFMIGTSFPYIEFLPKPGQARAVQIDLKAERLGLRYPADVGLVGDSKSTLKELLPLLKRKEDRKFLESLQDEMEYWWKIMEARGTRKDKPMKPQVPAWELGKRLSDQAIVACDSGTIATWWARQIPARKGQKFSLSGTLATMACGLPYAIAAQIAYPNRQVVAFVGDGGLSMLMAELSTCVKYQLPVKIIVIKNNTLGQIKWEQMVMLGNPEYVCDLQPIDFSRVAEACGVRGYTIDDPMKCSDILDQALQIPGPALVECVVDPQEPPLPAKIKPEQAKKFATALARGEQFAGKIIATVTEDEARELI